MRHLAVGRAEVFSVVGNPLPTSLLAGVDITVIALWLGHESISSTQEYLHADMQQKQEAIGKTASPGSRQKRYQPPDPLLEFLENL